MENITLQQLNKKNGEVLTSQDLAKVDSNSVIIQDTLNSLPSSFGSTVTTSTTNGNIKIDGVESKVYTAPVYTKSDVGLGNVDNTSDLNKPISTAKQM